MTIPLVYLAEGGLFIQHIITHSQLYTHPHSQLFQRIPTRNVQFLVILHTLFSPTLS